MINLEKTVSVKKDGKTYVNDVEVSRIFVIDDNGEYLHELPFCLFNVSNPKNVYIKKGLDVLPLNTNSKIISDIVDVFLNYEEPKKTAKKTSKKKKTES